MPLQCSMNYDGIMGEVLPRAKNFIDKFNEIQARSAPDRILPMMPSIVIKSFVVGDLREEAKREAEECLSAIKLVMASEKDQKKQHILNDAKLFFEHVVWVFNLKRGQAAPVRYATALKYAMWFITPSFIIDNRNPLQLANAIVNGVHMLKESELEILDDDDEESVADSLAVQ